MEAFEADLIYRFPEGKPTCPHFEKWLEAGYGLAGGGMGVYMYCTECGAILDKVQTE